MPRHAAAPIPPCPGTVCITRSDGHSGSHPKAHTAMAVAADSHRLPPNPPAGSGPALRRAAAWVMQPTLKDTGSRLFQVRLYFTAFPPLRQAHVKSPPQTGRATVCRKSLAEFRGRSREINFNHFRRRRVRRRKYFSRSGVSNCPPLADNRGAERSAGLFVEEGRAFFDKMKPAPNGTGRVFKRCRQAPCPGRARARRGS